jgi:hypothetical protein
MLNVDDIINELRKFSEDIIYIGEPIEDNRIEKFEEKYNLKLPDDFRLFISKCNEVALMGTMIYGFDPEKKGSTIESVYDIEHFRVIIPQYSYLVPFSPDGRGNFYCMDTSTNKNGTCNIIFWTSNYQYTENDSPEVTNSSFLEWVKEVIIDWTLEDYDYEGNEK